MANEIRLEVLGPRIFLSVGLLLLLLAVYMAGEDSLACRPTTGHVDCHVARTRIAGLVTVERFDVKDVVTAGVRMSSTRNATFPSGPGWSEEKTTTNSTLVLKTRDGHDVDTLGGETSGPTAREIVALIEANTAGRRSAPPAASAGGTTVETRDAPVNLDVHDSNLPIALVCGGLGLVFVVFSVVALRAVREA